MTRLDVGQVDGHPDAVGLGLGQRGLPAVDLDLQVGDVQLELLAVPAVRGRDLVDHPRRAVVLEEPAHVPVEGALVAAKVGLQLLDPPVHPAGVLPRCHVPVGGLGGLICAQRLLPGLHARAQVPVHPLEVAPVATLAVVADQDGLARRDALGDLLGGVVAAVALVDLAVGLVVQRRGPVVHPVGAGVLLVTERTGLAVDLHLHGPSGVLQRPLGEVDEAQHGGLVPGVVHADGADRPEVAPGLGGPAQRLDDLPHAVAAAGSGQQRPLRAAVADPQRALWRGGGRFGRALALVVRGLGPAPAERRVEGREVAAGGQLVAQLRGAERRGDAGRWGETVGPVGGTAQLVSALRGQLRVGGGVRTGHVEAFLDGQGPASTVLVGPRVACARSVSR